MNYIDELEREKAHADSMTAAAAMWMRRAQDAERIITALVHAAGGKIELTMSDLVILPELELIRVEQPWNLSVAYHARRMPRPEAMEKSA